MNDQELHDLLIKSKDDLLKALSNKKLSTLMDIGDIAAGYLIFHRVIHRYFGDKTEEVKQYLIDNGYATEETAYACPCCMHMIGRSGSDFMDIYLQEEKFFCYSCDEEISPKSLLTDWILVRTDKPWGADD